MNKIRKTELKRIVVCAFFALSLAGCAKLTEAYQSLSSSNVPPKAIYVAISAFDAAKITGTNYIRYCAPNPSPKGCNDAVIRGKLIPAINKGTVARNDLKAFVRAHPGELGPSGTYSLLTTSATTITTIVGDKK